MRQEKKDKSAEITVLCKSKFVMGSVEKSQPKEGKDLPEYIEEINQN